MSTLEVGDDPEGYAQLIEDNWVACSKIDLRKRSPAGAFKPATPLSFGLGDFVEVEVAVDVVLRRPKTLPDTGVPFVETRLRPLQISKLIARADLPTGTSDSHAMETQ